MGPAALVLSLIAAFLSATTWSFVGAPLGAVAFGMGALAVHRAHKQGRQSLTGAMALGSSFLAVLALPFFLWACNSWLSCV